MTGPRFVILDKSAHMPASTRGNYRRLGIVELRDPAAPVHMLSTRDKNVARIVETWEALNVGKNDHLVRREPAGQTPGDRSIVPRGSAYRRALVEAEAKCAILNAAPPRSIEEYDRGPVNGGVDLES